MQWTEGVMIDRPSAQVRAAVADENDLMAWSAWPQATGFACAVHGDGRSVGSENRIQARSRAVTAPVCGARPFTHATIARFGPVRNAPITACLYLGAEPLRRDPWLARM